MMTKKPDAISIIRRIFFDTFKVLTYAAAHKRCFSTNGLLTGKYHPGHRKYMP